MNQYLSIYLNDHLAGSVAALELVDYLVNQNVDTPLAVFFAGLYAEIKADRGELEAIMKRLAIAISPSRKVMAWLTEKLTQVKLKIDDPADGALLRLEATEALSLGIEGKRGLWLALAAAAEQSSSLRGIDYERLQRRAGEQRRGVEEARLEFAKTAFRTSQA